MKKLTACLIPVLILSLTSPASAGDDCLLQQILSLPGKILSGEKCPKQPERYRQRCQPTAPALNVMMACPQVEIMSWGSFSSYYGNLYTGNMCDGMPTMIDAEPGLEAGNCMWDGMQETYDPSCLDFSMPSMAPKLPADSIRPPGHGVEKHLRLPYQRWRKPSKKPTKGPKVKGQLHTKSRHFVWIRVDGKRYRVVLRAMKAERVQLPAGDADFWSFSGQEYAEHQSNGRGANNPIPENDKLAQSKYPVGIPIADYAVTVPFEVEIDGDMVTQHFTVLMRSKLD